MNDIELGDKVKCIYTGFTGIAVAKTEFINGCVQYGVAPMVRSGDKYPDEVSIDESSLKLVKKGPRGTVKETGGPVTRGKGMRGF